MMQTSMVLALAGFSFVLTVIWGPPFLRVLRHFNVGEKIRVDGPERHFSKLGTPTMGGLLIILPVTFITLLLNATSLFGMHLLGRSVLLPLSVMVAFGTLGAIDDWESLRGRKGARGMKAKTKFIMQTVLALIAAYSLKYGLEVPPLYLPGIKGVIKLGHWYIPIAAFVIVATSNAVNLTDGLDGLAIGCVIIIALTYAVLSYLSGHLKVSQYLQIIFIPEAGELTVFCSSLIGDQGAS